MGKRTWKGSGARKITVLMIEDEVRIGDNIFLIDISELGDKYLSSDTVRNVKQFADIFSITLERVAGCSPVKPSEFAPLVRRIEAFMWLNPKAILCFYCDFLNNIPSIRKTRRPISPQEYRSRLFSALFTRYNSHHEGSSYVQSVITIEGEENYYIHIIALRSMSLLIEQIAKDLQEAYGKE